MVISNLSQYIKESLFFKGDTQFLELFAINLQVFQYLFQFISKCAYLFFYNIHNTCYHTLCYLICEGQFIASIIIVNNLFKHYLEFLCLNLICLTISFDCFSHQLAQQLELSKWHLNIFQFMNKCISEDVFFFSLFKKSFNATGQDSFSHHLLNAFVHALSIVFRSSHFHDIRTYTHHTLTPHHFLF